MYWAYVLQSKKDRKLYVGSTSDVEKRLRAHGLGKVRSTKGRRPFTLIYSEQYDTVTQARQRENFLKTGQGREWLKRYVDNMKR